ncbi:putative reverse transcriptase domain-containing protein [Tanacetum coccineum]
MHKAVLKQQFEAFTISSSEGLEKGYERFQQLLSQLEAHGAKVSTEDANHKFLRSLPPAWSNLAMTMRTKPDVDTLSIDDLYNNLRVFEQELTSTSKSSASAQNVAFVSHSKSSTNKVKSGHTGAYSTYTPSTSSNIILEREVPAGFADEKEEAYASREAWAHTIGLSQAIHYELQTHCEQVYAHESQLYAHQTQLQLQVHLINKHSPVRVVSTAKVARGELTAKYQAIVPDHQEASRDAEVKFATCTLLGAALTCWNGQIRTLGPDALFVCLVGNDLMEQKLRHLCRKEQTDTKRKVDDSSRNNHGQQQQPFKRHNVTKGSSKNVVFDVEAPGSLSRRECPKFEDKEGEIGNAQGWVYAVGNAEKNGNASRNPDSNVVTGTFLLNNRYASILFDTGADRSFISTAFSSLIDIAPTPLENSYDVEFSDRKY